MASSVASSWYDSAWAYRWPIYVDVSAAGATSDITITIPADFDLFWDNVDSSGDDIRVTEANGRTLVTFDLAAGFNTTTRSGTIEVDNYGTTHGSGAGASGMLLWVYWGNAVASTGVSAFVPAAAISGYICTDAPVPEMTVQCRHEQAGANYPSQRLFVYDGTTHGVGVYTDICFDLTPVMVMRSRKYEGSLGSHGPTAIRLLIAEQTSKTTANASTYSEADYRFLYGPDGRLYVRFTLLSDSYLGAGTYTATCLVYSSHDSGAPYGYSCTLTSSDLL